MQLLQPLDILRTARYPAKKGQDEADRNFDFLRRHRSHMFQGNKWASFPSVAAAWRISDEAFLKNVEALSNLKLRLSWYPTAQSFAFLNNKSKVQESTATESSVRNWAYRRNSHYNDTYVALGGDRLWSDVDYSSFSVTFNYIPQRSEAYGEDC